MSDFIVIAHRGACGYLPEHTLESVALAHAMGADYVEQDVVMSRDGHLLVLHDLYLDAVTDVAARFPGRQRSDGRHYAVDFTLDEIRTLRLHERVGSDAHAMYSGRFPADAPIFRIPTLDEEILLIHGLNHSSGRNVGLYVEPKSPAWHAQQGVDLVVAVLDELARHGYSAALDRAVLQSFDQIALRYARLEHRSELRMTQLIGENSWRESSTDFDYLRSPGGLSEIAEYADGIGPHLPQVIDFKYDRSPDISDLSERAHALGLFVHAYTLRADQLPPGVRRIEDALRQLHEEAVVDGVFTDHPDRVTDWLAAAAAG